MNTNQYFTFLVVFRGGATAVATNLLTSLCHCSFAHDSVVYYDEILDFNTVERE